MQIRCCLGMLLVVLGVRPLLAGPTGYSVRSNADDHLYAIDLETGAATDLGLVDFGDAEGLSFAGGQLYAIGGTEEQFWNITTPPGFLVGETGPRSGEDAGLDFDSTQAKMFNVNSSINSSSLYEINIATGAATLIGSDSIFVDGLAIDPGGNAFAADWIFTESLYTVNLSNGDVTLVGPFGLSNFNVVSGLSFDPLGVLYALTSDGEIYTLNTATGEATFQAQVTLDGDPIADFEGLAIPEPSGLVLAALAILSLAVYGLRRPRIAGIFRRPWKRLLAGIAAAVVASTTGSAIASGAEIVLDQQSPYGNYGFNAHHDSLEWQQEITPGVSGQLVGVELYALVANTTIGFAVNRGPAWQSDVDDFQATVTLPTTGFSLIDTSSAGTDIVAGEPFVIKAFGLFSGSVLNIGGSQENPYAGGDLWLSASPTTHGLAFRTYVLVPEPGTLAIAASGGGLLAALFLCRRLRR